MALSCISDIKNKLSVFFARTFSEQKAADWKVCGSIKARIWHESDRTIFKVKLFYFFWYLWPIKNLMYKNTSKFILDETIEMKSYRWDLNRSNTERMCGGMLVWITFQLKLTASCFSVLLWPTRDLIQGKELSLLFLKNLQLVENYDLRLDGYL